MILTVDEVAELLSANPADALLALIVKAGNKWAMRRCGREFVRATRTHVVPGYGSDYVFLPEFPIISITEVRIDESGTLGTDTIITDLTVFKFAAGQEDSRLFYVGGCFPEAPRAVQVTCLAGYYPTTDGDVTHIPKMPEDLRLALFEEIAERYARGTKTEVMKSESMGAYSYTRFDSMHPDRKAVFNGYRR